MQGFQCFDHMIHMIQWWNNLIGCYDCMCQKYVFIYALTMANGQYDLSNEYGITLGDTGWRISENEREMSEKSESEVDQKMWWFELTSSRSTKFDSIKLRFQEFVISGFCNIAKANITFQHKSK